MSLMNVSDNRLLVLLLLTVAMMVLQVGCTVTRNQNQNEMANVSQSNGNASTSEAKTAPPESSAPDSLQVGQAVGSYTAKGEKVDLKYSYAGRGESSARTA